MHGRLPSGIIEKCNDSSIKEDSCTKKWISQDESEILYVLYHPLYVYHPLGGPPATWRSAKAFLIRGSIKFTAVCKNTLPKLHNTDGCVSVLSIMVCVGSMVFADVKF